MFQHSRRILMTQSVLILVYILQKLTLMMELHHFCLPVARNCLLHSTLAILDVVYICQLEQAIKV